MSRVGMHGNVSSKARDGWRQFSAEHGVTISGVMDAIGVEIIDQTLTEGDVLDLTYVIKNARKVDAQNRLRS